MASLPIFNSFHPLMRKKTQKVENLESVKELIQNLWDTLYTISNGVGLAANQIGGNMSVVVIDTTVEAMDDSDDPNERREKIVMINPEILEFSDELDTYQEGCLSVPEFYENVSRPEKIKIKYLNANFEEVIEVADGFFAKVMQHEVDHLNGVLFYERMTPLKRTLSRSKLNKIAKGKVTPKYDMVQVNGTVTKGTDNS